MDRRGAPEGRRTAEAGGRVLRGHRATEGTGQREILVARLARTAKRIVSQQQERAGPAESAAKDGKYPPLAVVPAMASVAPLTIL